MKEKKKISLTKKQRNVIITFAVLVAVVITGLIVFKSNQIYFTTKLMYAFMPQSYVAELDDGNIEFFVEYNKDYSAKESNYDPMQAFRYYYYDENGERVDLGIDGGYDEVGNGEKSPLSVPFMFLMGQRIGTFKAIMKKVLLALAAVIIVVLIIVWYIVWSRNEDKQKLEKYGDKPNKKNNKKTKK